MKDTVPMQNEPQLSAEMEKRFDEEFAHLSVLIDQALSYTYVDSKNMGELKIKDIKHFLATALEEQRADERAKVLAEVEGWLVDEIEIRESPSGYKGVDLDACKRNELRAELRAKLEEMKK